uniref:NADH-ubiquinone oxidoreductase chain 5 n=1 Tax=Nipponnemertes punctatula TaxID=1332184 RepID=X2C9V0_9BILA|nr:NADH dehydrogenase subunit 5 [Nipponnemertes punctatula]AGL46766.1 NADH dehydrogenase subunit 5 [Nipponnemertes punctatula]
MMTFFSLSISLFVSFILFFLFNCFSWLFFFFFFFGKSVLMDWVFFSMVGVELKVSIILDWVSVSFFCVVVLISLSVIWFSFYYMGGDPFVFRFTWLVVLFVLSMLFLIYIPNLIALLLGWDGLGLVSFCLVIYYQNYKSLVSGMLTVMVNRLGDVMLLLSIGWLVGQASWSYFFLEEFCYFLSVMICLVIAGMTKSAQFPFCSWLPAAMAAPTPVSALVHSSTLVTAGVYLIIRFWDFISFCGSLVFFLQVVSLITMLLAGVSALFETDMKKIIALSTLSQLSIMLFSVSLGLKNFGLCHLYTHALFKALLFLCAGCLIHSFFHVQDLRYLGFCWLKVPCVMVFLNVANLALCGFPFLGGFYSKDLILEFSLFSSYDVLSLGVLFVSTFLTVAYSLRFSLYSMFGGMKGTVLESSGDEYSSIIFPMVFLGLGAVVGGSFFFHYIFCFWKSFFFVSEFDKFFLIFVLWLGGVVGSYVYFSEWDVKVLEEVVLYFNFFCCSMWFLQNLSTQMMLKLPFFYSFEALYRVDRGFIEFFGGQGVLSSVNFLSEEVNVVGTKSVMIGLSFFFFFFLILFCVI